MDTDMNMDMDTETDMEEDTNTDMDTDMDTNAEMDKNIERFVYQILVKILANVRHNAKLFPLQSDTMLSQISLITDIGQSAHLRTKQTVPFVKEPWRRTFLKQFLTRWVQPMVKLLSN
jgi:hypothetical protein